MIKVSSVLQAAWLRFQEVQALHQLQPDLPYQEVPAGRRKRGWEGELIASVLQINRLILKNRTVEYIHARISEKFWWNTDPFAWVTDGARRSRRARWARGTLKMWRSIYYTYFLHIPNVTLHMEHVIEASKSSNNQKQRLNYLKCIIISIGEKFNMMMWVSFTHSRALRSRRSFN